MLYSPRVQLREIDARTALVFLDIASTRHFYQSEAALASHAANLARDLGFDVQFAVADTPAGAQAFAAADSYAHSGAHSGIVVPAGEERVQLKELSLPLLLQLEGLEPWARPTQIDGIVTFFLMLGFKKIGNLMALGETAFRERWGEVGAVLWRRLNALDQQVISPLLPTEPLEAYVHLDFPVSVVSLVLLEMKRSLVFLFARLAARRLYARKLTLTLHCEYSNAWHKIDIEPNQPSRDGELFLTLLENRLGEVSLENPIRDFEIHVQPENEQTRQLDFFAPRTTDGDKVQTLFSLLTQSALQPGFYEIQAEVLPERAWRLTTTPPKPARSALNQNSTATKVAAAAPSVGKSLAATPAALDTAERAISSLPAYGEAIQRAPRPARLLREPRALTIEERQSLRMLSSQPIERIENAWWEEVKDCLSGEQRRDYYFAVSRYGECLWIFQDRVSGQYFLHGFFD